MFMHVGGMGPTDKLATAIGKIFAKLREPSPGNTFGPDELDAAKTPLEPKKIEDILGEKGELAKGVYKVTIGRTTRMHGLEVGNAMGVNTWAAFVGSDEKAVVDGDFAMVESELQDVLKALRGAGINIVAIHNHMTLESPRIIFLHFWGLGSTTQLAQGLKARNGAPRRRCVRCRQVIHRESRISIRWEVRSLPALRTTTDRLTLSFSWWSPYAA